MLEGPLLMVAAVSGALAAPCNLEASADAAFEVDLPSAAHRVQLLTELWIRDDDVTWARMALHVLHERTIPATLVVPVTDDEPMLALVREASAGGHEIAVQLEPARVPRDLGASVAPLRASVRPVRTAAGRLRAIASPLPGRASEALLARAGFDVLLQTDGAPSASPRLGAVFEGETARSVVFHGGPYDGACGTQPQARHPFTPRAADRVASAVNAAIGASGAPTVRLVLDADHQQDTDLRVLGRWFDEVARPSGMAFVTPTQARKTALRAMREGGTMPPDPEAIGGRRVTTAQIADAAASLSNVQILPRVLPNDLNLTEAFYAMLLVLEEPRQGDVVRLGALQGPVSRADSALGQADVVEIPRDQVVAFARTLLSDLPASVPVSMRVGGRLLTAPELLGLLASAVRGEDPSTTRISASPEPNAPGQGWDAATMP